MLALGFLILPWTNTFNTSELEVININQQNIGYYQTNTCEFNLVEVIFQNFQNMSFEIKGDLYSDVECHGKINGMDLLGDKIMVYGSGSEADGPASEGWKIKLKYTWTGDQIGSDFLLPP